MVWLRNKYNTKLHIIEPKKPSVEQTTTESGKQVASTTTASSGGALATPTTSAMDELKTMEQLRNELRAMHDEINELRAQIKAKYVCV
jgi:hypothetical protein